MRPASRSGVARRSELANRSCSSAVNEAIHTGSTSCSSREVALDEPAHVASRIQVVGQCGEGGIELEVLGLQRLRRQDHAGLAGDEGREEHGVLGSMVMVQDRGQQFCPPAGALDVADLTPPRDMGDLGTQAEVDSDEAENSTGQVREHAADVVWSRL